MIIEIRYEDGGRSATVRRRPDDFFGGRIRRWSTTLNDSRFTVRQFDTMTAAQGCARRWVEEGKKTS